MGGGPHLHLGVVLKPHLHPLVNRVPSGLGRIQALRFLDRLFQLGLGLCLGFSQDVLVDGPARLRVAAGGISPFPSAIFPLAEVTLPVGPSFCHGLLPPLQQHNISQKERTIQGDGELFAKKFYRFSDYLGTTSQMSELLGISSISGILRFGRYPAYHGISEPHLAVKSSKTVVENRPYY